MNWRCASRTAAVLATVHFLFILAADDARSEEIGAKYTRTNTIGFNTALYHNRFIDDVITPVVYTSSSPLFEFSYRNTNDVRRHAGFISFGFYTAGLKDLAAGDDFELLYPEGDVYTLPRSLHQLDGSHFSAEYEYLRSISTLEQGKSAFHLGGRAGFYTDELSNIDHWGDEFEWRKDKTWLYDFSLALAGEIDRRFRESDRLSLCLRFTLLSLAYRPQYSSPIVHREIANSFSDKYTWMFPADFMRWSAQLSYELWFHKSFGLEAYYRFQHQRVSEPRDLRHVSHTFSLGIKYAIKASAR